jgi:GH24 family phage-related lysozyme (muramidase)
MSRLIISENDRKHIKSLYNILNEDAKSIAKNIYDASSGVGTDEDKFLKAVLEIDTLETFKEVDRILKTFDYGGGFYDYVEGELGMLDEELINKIKNHVKNLKSKFLDGTKLRASQEFWDHIKVDEGFSLKAYALDDDNITMGWGHAEPISTSKYRVGDTITMPDAEKYLREDATVAADCVRRFLGEWKEQGLNSYMISQSMFNVLVSIAFNAGCGGLRNSDFIKLVKIGKFKEAADMLPDDKKMWPENPDLVKGVKNRRTEEAKRFRKEL